MIGFMMTTFLETLYMMVNYLKGDTRWIEFCFLELWRHL
jgi:hypothetical protein